MKYIFSFLKFSLLALLISASITEGDWTPIFGAFCCWMCYKSIFDKMSLNDYRSDEYDQDTAFGLDDSYSR